MTVVHVPQNEAAEPIRALLKAAQELGLPASVVATSSDGVFGFSLIVPDEVHALAFPELAAEAGEQLPDEVMDKILDDPDAVIEELSAEPEPAPKKRGRPKKAAEPVVEEEE